MLFLAGLFRAGRICGPLNEEKSIPGQGRNIPADDESYRQSPQRAPHFIPAVSGLSISSNRRERDLSKMTKNPRFPLSDYHTPNLSGATLRGLGVDDIDRVTVEVAQNVINGAGKRPFVVLHADKAKMGRKDNIVEL